MIKVVWKLDVEKAGLCESVQDLNRWVEKCVGVAGKCQKLVEANGIHFPLLESTNGIRRNLLEGIYRTATYHFRASMDVFKLLSRVLQGHCSHGSFVKSSS